MTDPQPWRSDLPVPDGPAVGVPGYLFEHAARLGDKPALVDGPTGRTLSYRQLAGAVERVAAGLAARGSPRATCSPCPAPTCPSTRWPCTAPWPPGASSPAPTRC